jgi:hypothetical protein
MTDPLLNELARIRAARRASRRSRYPQSRLNRYRAQIERLAEAGASLAEIRDWLRRKARLVVARSTILRALRRWRGNDGG